MSDISIKNYYNAFIEVCIDNFVLVVDPWITQSIYGNSWVMPPEVHSHIETYFDRKKIDCCIITHIHEDHFDVTALSTFPDNCSFHIPDVYPNKQVAERKLKDKQVSFESFDEFGVNKNVSVQFIPPMNYDGYLSGKRQKDQGSSIAIDTGVLLRVFDKKILLLSDNMPFDCDSVCDSFDVHDCDLIAFPFNAFADDFPVCFDNIPLSKKREYARQRSESRLRSVLKFFDKCDPIRVMPYSSDFFVRGSRAIDFDKVLPDEYKSRKAVCDIIRDKTDYNCTPLSYNQELVYLSGGSLAILGEHKEFDFSKICKDNYFDSSCSPEPQIELFELIASSSDNMRDKLNDVGMETDWHICLNVIDQSIEYMINPITGCVHGDTQIQGPYIKCNIMSDHLEDILSFKKHWDNERIAYNLSWERHPDVHEPNIWKALNFFHS